MKQSAFIIFLTVVLSTDKKHAEVFKVFGNLPGRDEFACNTQVILQCIVNPRNNRVIWRVGNPITPTTSKAAECSGNSCSINHPVVSSIYDFSYDENSRNTNMTIKHVTLAEDGKQYKCDDGSTVSIFKSVVQVPPVKETTRILKKTMAEKTIITCSTGCVTNRTAQLVTFKWYKIDLDGSVSVYKDATPQSSSDDSPCKINSDCISNGSVALSNNFTITEDVTAPEVYFQVHILLDGDFLFSVYTPTFRLKISDGFNNTDNNDENMLNIIGIAVACICIAFTLTFVGYVIWKYSLNIAVMKQWNEDGKSIIVPSVKRPNMMPQELGKCRSYISNLGLKKSDVGDKHEERKARPLPRISSCPVLVQDSTLTLPYPRSYYSSFSSSAPISPKKNS